MNDLRARFGLILALALLPLLVLSIWHAAQDYRVAENVRQNELIVASRTAVADVIEAIDTAKSVLRSVNETVTETSCTSEFSNLLSAFNRFNQITIYDGNGKTLCSVPVVIKPLSSDFIGQLTPARPFFVSAYDESTTRPDGKKVAQIAYGRFEVGKLQQISVISSDIENLFALKKFENLPQGVVAAIVNENGKVVVSETDRFDAVKPEWVFQSQANGIFERQLSSGDGTRRELIVLPTNEVELAIAISFPIKHYWFSNIFNPLSSLLLPVLAWLFAFGAIWISTDKLLISHLRKLRKATSKFSDGDYDERIGTMVGAPDRLEDLGRSFDNMAEQIKTRDTKLKDSVEEKENLLREIHHRVKNNLQIIISLLNIQERKLEDPSGILAINEARNRINAIALIHRALYESEDLRFIPMNGFLAQLIQQLSRALLRDKSEIDFSLHVECDPMDADRAIPVSLFIVEAITNSIQHGMSENGKISVSVRQDEQQITVEVGDNGKHPVASKTASGTGTKLMAGFARQLSGTYSTSISPEGYTAIMQIPTVAG